jgi:regulator of protease activity HflC (stomatin/prohibitin superfamily)
MDIKTQKYEAEASAASKDLQTVTSKIATNYHLTAESVPVLYKEIGIDYQARVIQPLEQEVVKATTAKYTAEELITKREEVRLEMKQVLHDRLITKGIIVEEVSIVNFDFSPSFNSVIEAKVTAEQLKLKAENDLQRIKVEAEQRITQAQGEAEAIKIQATAINSQGGRDYVQLQAISRWDGKLPSVTGGVVPFINVNSAATTL